MIRKIINKLRTMSRYFKAIQGSDAWICFFDSLFNKETLRKITINGTQVFVRTNSPDIEVAVSSLHEKEYGHLKISNPKFIIDAGANIGTSALFFAKKYPQAKIIAIEPEEKNFEILKKNIEGFNNVIPIKAAIWGSSEKREIQNRFTGHWGFTVSETENKKEATGQTIDCIPVDALMEKYNFEKIDLFKMDIEGGEKNVLENSASWINKVDVMTVELHDRITMGCDRAFYLATEKFAAFEKHGEKVTAYQKIPA